MAFPPFFLLLPKRKILVVLIERLPDIIYCSRTAPGKKLAVSLRLIHSLPTSVQPQPSSQSARLKTLFKHVRKPPLHIERGCLANPFLNIMSKENMLNVQFGSAPGFTALLEEPSLQRRPEVHLLNFD